MSEQNDIYNVCEYIIYYENSNERPVTNLRLQKLLYFIQSYFLFAVGRPCFAEELQAWKYGPVVQEVYNKYKFFGFLNIYQESISNPENLIGKASDREAIEFVLNLLSDTETNVLVEISHNQEPWINAYNNGPSSIITKKSIRDFLAKEEAT